MRMGRDYYNKECNVLYIIISNTADWIAWNGAYRIDR